MSVRWFRVFFSVEVKILFVKKLLKPLLVKVKDMLGSAEHWLFVSLASVFFNQWLIMEGFFFFYRATNFFSRLNDHFVNQWYDIFLSNLRMIYCKVHIWDLKLSSQVLLIWGFLFQKSYSIQSRTEWRCKTINKLIDLCGSKVQVAALHRVGTWHWR